MLKSKNQGESNIIEWIDVRKEMLWREKISDWMKNVLQNVLIEWKICYRIISQNEKYAIEQADWKKEWYRMKSLNDIYDIEWKRGMKFTVNSKQSERKNVIEWKDRTNVIL